MKLLKWLREIGVAPPEINGSICGQVGPRSIAIAPEWHSQWLPDECGLHETRRHVGRSAEGFHAGIEVCYRLGMGRIEWDKAQSSPELARAHATQLENTRRERIPGCIGERAKPVASGCCLDCKSDAGIEMALLELHEIVAQIESDPAQN
jgi:hypothetical protein